MECFSGERRYARTVHGAWSTYSNPNPHSHMWQQWVTALLGLWTIVIPFIGITGAAFAWTLAITGIVIAILGVWSALESPAPDRRFQHQ